MADIQELQRQKRDAENRKKTADAALKRAAFETARQAKLEADATRKVADQKAVDARKIAAEVAHS